MREYSLSISSAFAQGLVQQHTGAVDSIAFETCHNMIPAGEVLLSQPTLTSIGASAKWPANQVFEGPNYYALEWSEEDGLSFYTLNTSFVTKTLVFTEKVKRFSDISKDHVLQDSGTLFQYITRGGAVYATNGTNSLALTPGHTTWGTEHYTTGVVPRTVCKHAGRVFYGGLRFPTLAVTHTWNKIIEQWKGLSPQNRNEITLHGIGSNWIFYMPTEERLADTGFDFEMALFSNYKAGDAYNQLRYFIETGEAGFIHIPQTQIIRTIKSLGNALIVYGDLSINRVLMEKGQYDVQTIHRAGVLDRCSVDGNSLLHICLTMDSELIAIGESGSISFLDYSNYMKTLTAGTGAIVVLAAPDNRYYISNGSTTYLLSEVRGLSTSGYAPTYIGMLNKKLYSYRKADDTIGTFSLKTTPLKMSQARFKILDRIELSTTSASSLLAGVDYSYQEDTFSVGALKRGNKENVFFVRTCAHMVKLKVSGSYSNPARIEDFRAKWHVGDGRYNPGLFGAVAGAEHDSNA